MSFLTFWFCFVLFLGRFIWFCKSGVAKHIKKKRCLGNSYVEKSIIFGFLGIHWTSCTYFNNCVLGDFNWAGPVGWAKTRSKTSQKKTIGLIAHIWHKLTNHRDYVPISNQFFWMSRPKVIKKKTHTNKQVTTQINKRTNKETHIDFVLTTLPAMYKLLMRKYHRSS